MDIETRNKIETLILEQFPRFQGVLERYKWPNEQARWHELVFCILSAHGQELFAPPLHRDVAREAVEALAKLDLLRLDVLEDMIDQNGALNEDDPLTLLRAAVLERLGYSTEVVDTVLVTVAETARTLNDSFGGKMQTYLRKAGDQVVRNMVKDFRFSSMSEERSAYVFRHWLQNALEMPIGLHNPSLLLLCESIGVDPKDLIQVAEEADLNLAILDDMVIDFVERNLDQPSTTEQAA